ncbi:response regulator transcription factor, partial [Pelomonas sp. KK5]|uniref:response regulator transcription factor n=1 Tax=Pelomonas sp. KK5 TaxID=1855730 RepID=UPI0018EA22BF
LDLFEGVGALPAAEALRRRLREQGIHGPRQATRERPFGLTGRELQVLRLLCQGLPEIPSNAEIARQLSRSVRTVDHHLAAVFAKLGVDSRAAAVQAAGAAGLAPKNGQSAPAN